MLRRLLEKFCRLEVLGHNYLRRWVLCEAFGFRLYLHEYLGSDEHVLHDHPNGFLTIPLKGWYYDVTHIDLPGKLAKIAKTWDAARSVEWDQRITDMDSIRAAAVKHCWDILRSDHRYKPVRWPTWRPATHMHRVMIPQGEKPWTLVLMFPHHRDWGFLTAYGWVDWRSYTSRGID